MRPDSQTRATLVLTPSEMGFKKGEIGRSGQVPILGISYHEIENVLASRKLNHGGVPHSGADTDDLIRVVGNMNNRWVRCRRSRRGGGAGLRRRFRRFPVRWW